MSALLSEFYHPLDLGWVKKTYIELGHDHHDDADEFLADCCRCDPLVLAMIIWPRLKATWFQKSWMDRAIRNQISLILGPRDHGKSQWTSRLIPPWGLINNRDLRFVGLSGTKNKAKHWAINTRRILEMDVITHLFGDFKGEDWLKMEFAVSGRSDDVFDPSMVAFGPDAGLTSFHPDVAIGDDVVDIQHYRFVEKRERLLEFIAMTFEPAMEPWTQRIWVGTRYSPEDYYANLIASGVEINEGTNRCFVDDPETDIDEMRKPLWPEKFSVETLQKMYLDMGNSAFRLQMFNDAEVMTGRIWSDDMFLRSTDHYDGSVVLGVDTAFREKSVNDESAICAVRHCRNTGQMVIENCISGRWGGVALADNIESEYRRHGAKWIVLEDPFKNNKSKRDIFFLRDLLKHRMLPVTTWRPSTDKISRYHAILPLWEAGQVLHRPGLAKLEKQMRSVPGAKHDDCIDALELAVSYFKRRMKKAGPQGRPLN